MFEVLGERSYLLEVALNGEEAVVAEFVTDGLPKMLFAMAAFARAEVDALVRGETSES